MAGNPLKIPGAPVEAWWYGSWYPATILHPPRDGVVSVAWVGEFSQSPLPIEDIRPRAVFGIM